MDARRILIYRQIGAKIAYYRTIEGFSQEAFARKISISKSTLSKIERGKYSSGLSIATLLDIADGLSVGMTALLLCSEEEQRVLTGQLDREESGEPVR